MIICLCLLFAGRASAQWVVSDPGNLAQGIINASKNIIHTSKTATNMVSNFQETVKIYQQGKKYYDALKSVNNLVKDARKVQQTILMVGDITDIYVNSFQRMLRDGNFRPEELSAIAFGYTKLLEGVERCFVLTGFTYRECDAKKIRRCSVQKIRCSLKYLSVWRQMLHPAPSSALGSPWGAFRHGGAFCFHNAAA